LVPRFGYTDSLSEITLGYRVVAVKLSPVNAPNFPHKEMISPDLQL
jgi:hypothetical protein